MLSYLWHTRSLSSLQYENSYLWVVGSSSLGRDQTLAPTSGVQSLNHWANHQGSPTYI